MFEQSLEETTTAFFLDTVEARLCSEYGVALHGGNQSLSYAEAVCIVRQMDQLFISLPTGLRKRWKAISGSLRNAFGPEFWTRHPDHTAVEAKAFHAKTRWA